MKLQTYSDQKITVLWSTPEPNKQIHLACKTTMMRKALDDDGVLDDPARLLKFLTDAEHTSVLEHVVFSFYIEGVSRSLLAQLTRHRMGSFTSASQHYQDYRDYPCVVHPAHAEVIAEQPYRIDGESLLLSGLEISLNEYTVLVDHNDVPPEEARQVLPNAAAVNIQWTVNARSLHNFFRQRCCNRNVMEMRIFTEKIRFTVFQIWPAAFNIFGPQCFTGACKQGSMQCKQKQWEALSESV